MEDTLQIDNQVPVQEEPPIKKLYNGLYADKKYTKSFDEFRKQYSTPDAIDKLYNGLKEDGDYTKPKEDFQKQYFQDIKKKVGTVDFTGSSLQAGNDLSQSGGVGGEKIPEVTMYGNNEIVPDNDFDKAIYADELRKRTKVQDNGGGSSFGMGTTNSTVIPDEDAAKIADQIDAELATKKVNSKKIAKDFEGINTEDFFSHEGTTKESMLKLDKENPIKYNNIINNAKTVYAIADNSDIHTANRFNQLNDIHYGSLGGFISGKQEQQDIINSTLTGDAKLKAHERLKENASPFINAANPDLVDEYNNSPVKNKIDANQYAGLKTLQIFEPEKYQLALDIINTDNVPTGGTKPLKNLLSEDLFSSQSNTKPNTNITSYQTTDKLIGKETILRQLSEQGRSNLKTSINREQYGLNSEFEKTTDPIRKEQIKQQYLSNQNFIKSIDEDAKQDDIKYPITAKLKFENQAKEITQQAGLGMWEYGANRFGKGFLSTANTIEDVVTGLFGSDKDNIKLQEKRLGEGQRWESQNYLPENLKSENSPYILKPTKELKDEAKKILNGRNLSDLSEVEKSKLTELVKNNQDQIETITNPEFGKSKNIFTKATGYQVAGFTGDIASFMAQTMGLGAVGLPAKAAELTTLFTTAYAPSFDEATKMGMSHSQAHGYGMVHGGIMMLAGTVSSKFENVKNMLAASKSPLSKEILGIGEAGWNKIVNGNKSTIAKIADATKNVAKENAKMIATYGVGTSIVGDLANKGFFNQNISNDEIVSHAVQSAKDMAIGSLAMAGVGFISHIAKNPVSLLEKTHIWEAGDNPEIGKAKIDEAIVKGDLTQQEGDLRKKAVDNISNLIQKVPQKNDKGKDLTDKEKVEYLYNSVVKDKAKEAAKDLPPKQAEVADEKALVAEHTNQIILDQPTEKQLNDRKGILERKLEPKKDAEGNTIEIPEADKKQYQAELQAVNDAIDKPKEVVLPTPEKVLEGTEQSGKDVGLKKQVSESKNEDEFVKNIITDFDVRYKNRKDADFLTEIEPTSVIDANKPNQKIDQDVVNEWQQKIEKGERPPIIVRDNGEIDGQHKLEAYKNLEFDEVPVIYEKDLRKFYKQQSGKDGVVDKEYYHGTNADFVKFELGKRNPELDWKDGVNEFGHYFATDIQDAKRYAGESNSARIVKATLDLKKTLDFGDLAEMSKKQFEDFMRSKGIELATDTYNKDTVFEIYELLESRDGIKDKLIKNGYDSISYKEGKDKTVVVFDDKSIKQSLSTQKSKPLDEGVVDKTEANQKINEAQDQVTQYTNQEKETGINNEPPDKNSKTAGEATGGSDKGITQAANKVRREETGLSEFEKIPESFPEWTNEAERLLKNGYDVEALMDRLQKPNETATPVENAIRKIYYATIDAEVAKNPTDKLLAIQKRNAQVGDIANRRAGQQLVSLKGEGSPLNSISDFYVAKMEASGVDKLTEQQKKDTKEAFDNVQKADENANAAMEAYREEITKLKAENELLKEKKSSTKKVKGDFVQQRKDAIQGAREALKKLRTGESGLSAVPLPGIREFIAIAPHVKKYVGSLLGEGAYNLKEVVSKAYVEFKDILEGITEKDIHNIIAGEYTEKKPTRNELAAKMRDLKDEAFYINKLEKLLNGGEPKKENEKVKRNQQIIELQKKIKDFEKEQPLTEVEVKAKLQSIKKQNENQEAKIKERIQKGEFETKKIVPFLEDVEMQKKFPEQYNATLDAIKAKEDARHEFDIALLRDQMSRRTKGEWASDNLSKAAGTVKAVTTGIDDSAVAIQTYMSLLLRPRTGVKAVYEHFRQGISQKKFDRWISALHSSSDFKLMKDAGLDVTEPTSLKEREKEEIFNNRFNGTVKIKGREYKLLDAPLKPFERAFTTLGNVTRVVGFRTIAAKYMREGYTWDKNPEIFKSLAKRLNNETGRGSVNEYVDNANKIITMGIWSPKLMAMKFNILGISDAASLVLSKAGTKGYYRQLHPRERIEALKDVAQFTTTIMALSYGMALGFGGTVDDDILSSTFMDVKFKNGKSYNFTGGFSGYIRAICQFAMGQKSKNGVAEKHGRLETAGRFFRGKTPPLTSTAINFAAGKDFMGNKTTPLDEATHLLPISLQGIYQQIERDGASSLFTQGIPTFVGFNVKDAKDFEKDKVKPDKPDKKAKPIKKYQK